MVKRDDDGDVTGTLKRGPFRHVVAPSTVSGIELDGYLLDLDNFAISKIPT